MNSVSEMIRDVKMEMTPADPKHHHNKHIIMGKGPIRIIRFVTPTYLTEKIGIL